MESKQNNQEKQPVITPEKVVGAFRVKGRENPQALELLNQWQEQEMARRDTYEITETDVYLNRAKILRDAGFVQEAIDCFEDVKLQAFNEYNDALESECDQEITKLKQKLGN